MDKNLEPISKSKSSNNEPRPRFRCHRENRDVSGGILFILAGITLLLNYAGTVSWDIWRYLFLFWPVLIILLGLRIILGNALLGNFLYTVIAVIVFSAVWTRALVEIESPLVESLGLSNLPWYDFVRQFNLPTYPKEGVI